MTKTTFSGAVVAGAIAAAAIVPAFAGASGRPGDAHVAGVVRDCGGPAPGHCFAETGFISARNSAGHITARQHLSKGRYSLALTPGRYRLVVKSGGGPVAKRSVTVRAHHTTRKNIIISIR